MVRFPVIAIAVGLSAIFAAVVFSSKDPGLFVNIPGLMIIIGGVLTALFFSYSKADILLAIRAVKQLFDSAPIDKQQTIRDLTGIAYLWSRHDLRAIEKKLPSIDNSFLRTGVQHIIDGRTNTEIASVLQWKIRQLHNAEYRSAKMFHSLATFAPAFGMVGTLLGLVNMMFLINDQEMTSIANHLAIALVTTFYGLIFANIFFKPIAIKLERRADGLVEWMRVLTEGIMMIEQRKSAAFIELAMETLDPYQPRTMSTTVTSSQLDPIANP
ncbi:motility protein A [Alkalimarinus sediminis]|uniref:MotA/TolQ/ExbB proton channel family protein n=1 Tax=Alkalimarinus sediminis TaxID=1632866 RepID=A0A9E8HLP9_9ALTE|nr:MotA/TolQ/ExbB proton channel family protein [Alkalimarinus sediminis]UZW76615.1 MotA/TolQ/ExbB proton channel family protein [Alkalimarinus sediminis]